MKGNKWKCTKCKEMVAKNKLRSHKCSPIADLKTGNKQIDWRIELAYMREHQPQRGDKK